MRGIETVKEKISEEMISSDKKGAFSDWLWTQLQNLYVSEEESADPLGLIQKESISEGLADIYEHLDTESNKLVFRQSIGKILIKHKDEDVAHSDTFKDLIYLIARIDAVESLDALALINLDDPHSEYLFNTIAVLESLSPSPQVQKIMFQLVNSANFDDGYLFSAIGILAECVPSSTTDLLLKFQPRLESLRENVKKLDSTEWTAYSESANDLIGKIQNLNPTSNLDTIKQVFFG